MNFKKSENVPKIFTRRFDNMSQGPNTSRVDLVADAWTRGAIVTSSCCMTRRPPLPDLIVLHRRHTLVHCYIAAQYPGQGTAWGICALALALCGRKIQKFGVEAALSRVFIGKQRVPPGCCSPSRDTPSLQGQQYSGEARGETSTEQIKDQSFLPFSLNAFNLKNSLLSSGARGYQTF